MSDELSIPEVDVDVDVELDIGNEDVVPVDNGSDSEVDGAESVVEVCKDGPGRIVIPRSQLQRHLAEGFVLVEQEDE